MGHCIGIDAARGGEHIRNSKRDSRSAARAALSVSWDWMSLLLSRIWTAPDAPVVRKWSSYRLFKGQAGILLSDTTKESTSVEEDNGGSKKKKKAKKKTSPQARGAPLSILTPDFVFDVIIPSYDTLGSSVGLHMNDTENNTTESIREMLLGQKIRKI